MGISWAVHGEDLPARCRDGIRTFRPVAGLKYATKYQSGVEDTAALRPVSVTNVTSNKYWVGRVPCNSDYQQQEDIKLPAVTTHVQAGKRSAHELHLHFTTMTFRSVLGIGHVVSFW